MRGQYVWCVGLVQVLGLTMLGAALPDAQADDFQYVGSKSCKKCHFDIWESWSKTKMGSAFHVLQPNAALRPSNETHLTEAWIAEIKTNKAKAKANAKIDPEKDYTREAGCLKCHTTGYGQPGGYALFDEQDKKAKRKAQELEGVGCESCHGPGSKYVKLFEEIQEKQRPYTRQELYAAGMINITVDTCMKCHNKESPLVGEDYVFDYEKRKQEGIHKRVELKLRKE